MGTTLHRYATACAPQLWLATRINFISPALFTICLQYAICAWGSATKNSLHRLNTLHNKIIKTISWSSYRCHVTPLFSQLNLLKLEDIHQLEIAKLMHSFHSNRTPNTFDRLFTAVNSVHTHETRSSRPVF